MLALLTASPQRVHAMAALNEAPLLRTLRRGVMEEVARVKLFQTGLDALYGRRFNRVGGQARMFRGIYPSFDTAMAAIPHNRTVGCDNDASAYRVVDDRLRIHGYDYPVMFWLSRLLPDNRFIFDWGGNVGISYFAYRRCMEYPDGITWLVNDVPSAIALGRHMAAGESASGLRFTEDLDELPSANILLAAGSMHLIEEPMRALSRVPRLPEHVLINKLPAYDLPAAVTLCNMGTALCPYHLFNRTEFIAGFERLGFTLIDQWRNDDMGCRIPLHRDHSIDAFSGFYFRRQASAAAREPTRQPGAGDRHD